MLSDVLQGLVLLLEWQNIFLIAIGALLGVLVGAFPGMGATLAIALLLPVTFGMRPESAMMLLIAIYCGGMYAGSITGIIYGIPGTAASVATTVEGYPLNQKGEGNKALISAVASSWVGGNVGWIFLLICAPVVARLALRFGPPEFFMLAVFGLTIIAALAKEDLVKGIISGCIGLFISTIGIDQVAGTVRFTYGIIELYDGFGIVVAIIGIFAMSQAFVLVRTKGLITGENKIQKWDIWGTLRELSRYKLTLVKSSIIGTLIGAVPGVGGSVASWVAYNEAKRSSKHPELFGTGTIEGIAASEASNNAVVGGALIPMLILGIPGDGVTAVILGAITMVGLRPGPTLLTEQGPVVYSILLSILIANSFFLLYGFTFVRYITKINKVSVSILVPVIIVFASIGSYTANMAMYGVVIAFILGTICYILKSWKFPLPSVLLGYVLGPMAEANLNRSMIMSDGSWLIFFTRPMCWVFILFICLGLYQSLKKAPVSNVKA